MQEDGVSEQSVFGELFEPLQRENVTENVTEFICSQPGHNHVYFVSNKLATIAKIYCCK